MNGVFEPRALRVALLSCCAWTLLGGARAEAEISLDADIGADYSDNVARAPVDEESDTIGTVRIGVGIEETRPRLRTRLDADLQYRHYLESAFDNEIVGGLSGELGWSILPERLIWVVEDNYGQLAANRAFPDSPANRQDFNYFSTGPDLHLPFGQRMFFNVSGRWSDVYYEDTDQPAGPVPGPIAADQGSNSMEGSLALGRQISEQSTFSLNGSVEEITYDDEQFDDYRVTEAYLRYDVDGGRTQLSLDAGYTEAVRDEQSTGGLLGRFNLSREITSRSTLSLDVGTEFADTASAFRLDQVAGGVSPEGEDAIATNDVFRTNYAYVRLSTERERTTFEVNVNARSERYEHDTLLDREMYGGGLYVTRRLSPRLDLDFRGTYTHEDFVNDDFASGEWSVGAGLAWRLSRQLSIRFTADHYEGAGDGTSRDYEENRLFLGLRYSSRR